MIDIERGLSRTNGNSESELRNLWEYWRSIVPRVAPALLDRIERARRSDDRAADGEDALLVNREWLWPGRAPGREQRDDHERVAQLVLHR